MIKPTLLKFAKLTKFAKLILKLIKLDLCKSKI